MFIKLLTVTGIHKTVLVHIPNGKAERVFFSANNTFSVFKVMVPCIHMVINITVAADGAGVSGNAFFGTGRLGYNSFINMAFCIYGSDLKMVAITGFVLTRALLISGVSHGYEFAYWNRFQWYSGHTTKVFHSSFVLH